jgi:hypothetical protein
MRRALIALTFLCCAAALYAQNVANYMEQGGARWVIGGSLDVASGGDLDVESGGTIKIAGAAITGSAAELNLIDGSIAGTSVASKALVLGTNKNTDILALPVSGLKIGAGAGTAVDTTAAELNTLNGVTAGTTTASKALVVGAAKDLDTLTITGNLVTADGVGAKNGAAVAVVELGTGAVHKTVFTLTALSITVTDTGGAAGAQGGAKIYDFPEGVIVRGGCTANLTTLAGAGGIADGAALVGSLGEVVAGVGDATLSGTEADFIASYAGTLVAGAGVITKYGEPSVTSLDGHTTPIDLFLNVAVPDADVSSSDTVAVSGTITCVWTSTGDF